MRDARRERADEEWEERDVGEGCRAAFIAIVGLMSTGLLYLMIVVKIGR